MLWENQAKYMILKFIECYKILILLNKLLLNKILHNLVNICLLWFPQLQLVNMWFCSCHYLFTSPHKFMSSFGDNTRKCTGQASVFEKAISHISTFSGSSVVLSIVCLSTLTANFLASRTFIVSVQSAFRMECAAWLFAPIAVAAEYETTKEHEK